MSLEDAGCFAKDFELQKPGQLFYIVELKSRDRGGRQMDGRPRGVKERTVRIGLRYHGVYFGGALLARRRENFLDLGLGQKEPPN